MLERAMRSIAAELQRQKEDSFIVVDVDFAESDTAMIDGWVDLRDMARAVIASLREPSDHMKRVGARYLYTLPLVDHELEETADAWRLMIDAVLEEPKA